MFAAFFHLPALSLVAPCNFTGSVQCEWRKWITSLWNLLFACTAVLSGLLGEEKYLRIQIVAALHVLVAHFAPVASVLCVHTSMENSVIFEQLLDKNDVH